MRKGADSYGRPADGHASRGVRHPRRRDSAWLIMGATSNPLLSDYPHHTAGALALNSPAGKTALEPETRRCALVVEDDPTLAEALTRALQARLEPTWSVRHISDSRLLATSSQSDVPAVIIIDANLSAESGPDNAARLSAISSLLNDAQMIFVTSDTSYQLSQRGIMSGVVLREWRHPDDIVSLIAEALTDIEATE